MTRDVIGERAKFGVIIPETNTVVEHDYALLHTHGVTYHYGRAHFTAPPIESDNAFDELVKSIHEGSYTAIDRVMTARPDHMIMGMSAETFWGGAKGNQEFEDAVSTRCNLKVTTGASATRKALELYGARRIAVLCPYPPIGVEQVSKFYADHGFDVADAHGFASESPAAMAQITDEDSRPVLQRFISADVDAIVQAGTNLSMIRMAAAAETYWGRSVIPINEACVWDALRTNGITDQIPGLGRLLAEH